MSKRTAIKLLGTIVAAMFGRWALPQEIGTDPGAIQADTFAIGAGVRPVFFDLDYVSRIEVTKGGEKIVITPQEIWEAIQSGS